MYLFKASPFPKKKAIVKMLHEKLIDSSETALQ